MMVYKDRTAMVIGYIILDINNIYTRYVVSGARSHFVMSLGMGSNTCCAGITPPHSLVITNVNKTWG